MQVSLFDDNSRSTKQSDKLIAKKTKEKKSRKGAVVVKSNGVLAKINLVRKFVEEHLGKYKDQFITITDVETLRKYVEDCGRVVALDTETTGLDPMLNKVVGIGLYSPNCVGAYIPLRHRSPITGELL